MAGVCPVIKTAVVGFGLSATVFHLPFIQASNAFELVAICSSQKQEVLQRFPGVALYESVRTMLEESGAELVVIAAPSDVHYSLVQQVLNHDKHVIVEKPFVTSVEQGEALIRLADVKRKVLAVFHNRRWDGDFLTVKHLIKTGQLGEFKYFESHFDRFRPEVRPRWREQPGEGTGILFDLGPHLVDQALCLFGMPQAVTARCLASRKGAQVDDFFNIWLHYANHEVVLQSSPYAAAKTLRFHLQGTEGSYVKYGLDPQEELLRQGVSPKGQLWCSESVEDDGVLYRADTHFTVPTHVGGYQHFFENVAEAVAGQGDLAVLPQEALNGIKIIELAMQSSCTGKTVAVC